MRLLKIIVLSVIGLAVALVAGIYVRNKTVGPEGWAMDNTEIKLRSQMRDPESMIIRSSYTVVTTDPTTNNRVIHICGVVDGKNVFGGYTGGMRFVSRSVLTSLDTFDTYAVTVEDLQETATARAVDRRSGFETAYWDPNCEGRNVK